MAEARQRHVHLAGPGELEELGELIDANGDQRPVEVAGCFEMGEVSWSETAGPGRYQELHRWRQGSGVDFYRSRRPVGELAHVHQPV